MNPNDDFLQQARRDPRPGFEAELRRKLRAQSAGEADAGYAPRPLWRRVPVLAATAALAAAMAIAFFPSVRASAEAFLDLFRVRNFVAIQFDGARLDKLRALDQDHQFMVLDHTEDLKHAPPPKAYPNADAAGVAAGMDVREPAHLPNGFARDSIFVEQESEAHVTVNEAKMRAMLDALDLKDVEIPPGLAGQSIVVRKPPVVVQTYRRGGARIALIQAHSPEVALPAGVHLQQLGEIGLRVLGLSRGEARKIAESIDWNSTLVIPVPINASSFRRVTVQGHPGLLVTSQGDFGPHPTERHGGTILLWSVDDRVYGLVSGLNGPDLVEVAESVR